METYRIENLTFTYPDKDVPAITNINLEVSEGEFLLVSGKSGCGKTTLLRSLKPALKPFGQRSGEIFFMDQPLDEISERDQAGKIGYVLQNPDSQIVTDKVWHELAFGLENLGVESSEIRIRVAEMASFFGIQGWFEKNVNDLSGGQKQILNLAAVMLMQPEVLVLDEPTSQLDPIAAAEFMATVKKINMEIGTTIIMTEHRLESVLPLADKVLVLDKGQVLEIGAPRDVWSSLSSMPAPLEAYAMLRNDGYGAHLQCPLDVAEGRKWLEKLLVGKEIIANGIKVDEEEFLEDALTLKNVWFRYAKKEKDVIKDLNFKVKKGEFLGILGGNGTGKTTALTLMAGLNKPYTGKIKANGVIGMLPQNPQSILVSDVIETDLLEMLENKPMTDEEKIAKVKNIAEIVEIEHIIKKHPFDVSGGEQQRVALGKILLMNPDIILLDEPTKGMDNIFKEKLAVIFQRLKDEGKTIVMVSHDVEFCGKYTDRCAMFFDGSITTQGVPRVFFAGNSFYTTSSNKMSRKIYKNAISAEDIYRLTKANLEGKKPLENEKITKVEPEVKEQNKTINEDVADKKSKVKITTAISGIVMALSLWFTAFYGSQQVYMIASMIIMFAMMAPVFAYFEGSKPQAREVITIAVMISLAVASRAALFMFPQIKAIFAIIIIGGVALGPSSGFIIGAMSAFISNFIFGQGPWTPFQMVAWALIGLVAGLLAKNLLASKKPTVLAIYGIFATFVFHVGITEMWSVLTMTESISLQSITTIYLVGIGFNITLALATAGFLLVLSKPMLNKIDRIKMKYGLLT